jgi:hypothetical protein
MRSSVIIEIVVILSSLFFKTIFFRQRSLIVDVEGFWWASSLFHFFFSLSYLTFLPLCLFVYAYSFLIKMIMFIVAHLVWILYLKLIYRTLRKVSILIAFLPLFLFMNSNCISFGSKLTGIILYVINLIICWEKVNYFRFKRFLKTYYI